MPSFDRPGGDAKSHFILRLCQFFAPILLVWLLLEVWTIQAVPSSYAIRRSRLETLAGRVDTIIAGSSHAYAGIVPDRLDGFAYNIAGVSESLDYDYWMLNRVVPSLPKLKLVILEIQDLTFFYRMSDSTEAWRQYYYWQDWDILPPSAND
jgi:hypothetical protein